MQRHFQHRKGRYGVQKGAGRSGQAQVRAVSTAMHGAGLALFLLVLCPFFVPEAHAGVVDSPLLAHAAQVSMEPGLEGDTSHGNHIAIINDAADALLLRVHLIRSARKTIDIQTLILADDECGRLIVYELIQAARRGVKIRLLTDHFMSTKDRNWLAFISTVHPNFRLKYYRPPAGFVDPVRPLELASALVSFRGTNQRMHNKIFLIDGILAVTGGRNIDNHYYNCSTTYNFIDRDAIVAGPLLPAIAASFEDYWDDRRAVFVEKLTDVALVIRKNTFRKPETRHDFKFDGLFDELFVQAGDPEIIRKRLVDRFVAAHKAEFVADAPGKNRSFLLWGGGKVTRRIRKFMKGTEESLYLQSPYLVLNAGERRSFRKLRRKRPEVKVTVSTNSFAATDNTLAYSANFKLRPSYIQNMGFRIYELKPRPTDFDRLLPNHADLERRGEKKGETRKPFVSIHAKTFVRDDRYAYVGSYNIDPRSAHLNSEVGLFIDDTRIAKALKEEILSRTSPGSSWVIARKEIPLADVNYLIEGISGLSPVDIWPLRNTSSFELLPDKEPVDPYHEDFYNHYKDVGNFPGTGGISAKEITTRLYKVLGSIAIPMI